MMSTSFLRIALFSLLLFGSIPAFAGEINIALYQNSIDDNVTIKIENKAKENLFVKRVDIDFDQKRYVQSVADSIHAHQSKEYQFKISFPKKPGSYPIISTVVYLNDGQVFSLRNLGIYNFMEQVPAGITCSTKDVHLVEEGQIVIESAKPEPWRLVLPEEIEVIASQTLKDRKIFTVRSHVERFKNRYQFYAVAEDTRKGRHRMAVCVGNLFVDGRQAFKKGNGRIPPIVLLFSAVVFFASGYLIYRKDLGGRSRREAALLKYSSRMFLITFAYLFLQNIDDWISHLSTYIEWEPIRFIGGRIVEEYRGNNFISFFHYFVDAFFLLCLLLLYPYLYFYEHDTTVEKDKYASLMISILSVIHYPKTRRFHWSPESRLGLLTFLVKFFFLPIMTTWVIDHAIDQINMTESFYWDFAYVNVYLVALFLYIDTAIFCFGYLFESKKLNSEIKSVEPTILGWVVCLWCYPPFRSFAFVPFDHQIINIQHDYSQGVLAAGTVVITVLWGIYAWATVALGFKASNLTNRGIVGHGPYRYVRHPAYAAKVTLWCMQGFLFGKFLLGAMLGAILIYVLRAWTEERHLSMDPDYRDYRKKVRYMFFPGLF